MGVHPYCILPPGPGPAADLRGVGGAPVTAIPAGRITIWLSELSTAPDVDLEALRAHDRVVGAATAGERTPLPVRFGGWMDRREELVSRIREREEMYASALSRVAGAREFGLRILRAPAAAEETAAPSGPRPEPVEARSGTDYLRSVARRHRERRRRRQHSDEILEALRDAIGDRVRGEHVERIAGSRDLLSVAHLVDGAEVDDYRASVEHFRDASPDLRVVSTGPWAPYSFTPAADG